MKQHVILLFTFFINTQENSSNSLKNELKINALSLILGATGIKVGCRL